MSNSSQILEGGGSNPFDPFTNSLPIQPGPYDILLNILLKAHNIKIIEDRDDFVEVSSCEDFILFYKSSSVELDEQQNLIVWTKMVYTDKGKNDFLAKFDSGPKSIIANISYSLQLIRFDCKSYKYTNTQEIHYTKSGNEIIALDYPVDWRESVSGGLADVLLTKIINDKRQ